VYSLVLDSSFIDNILPQLYAPKKTAQSADVNATVTLSDGTTEIGFEKARSFMDYYCRRYNFGKPDIAFEENWQRKSSTWDAIMTVGGKRIGLGSGSSKKAAQIACYLDVTKYLESCDPQLWATYVEAAKTGKDLGMAPKVVCVIGDRLGEEIKDLCYDLKRSVLYRNRPAIGTQKTGLDDPEAIPSPLNSVPPRRPSKRPDALKTKSQRLLQRQQAYLADPKLETMRRTRMSLPVYTRADEVVESIKQNDVMILMAATGSGKTTQVPQLILDDYIARGEGANCNIICTQPRRIAALSVADRVAKERGEVAGRGTVGYQVRFDSKPPEEHGSITFCTTGVFLKKMQTALVNSGREPVSLDDVTHVVVDEVHERDVDTDLLLVVLKRLLADRKARNVPIKIVLMSATIDPTIFQRYFLDEQGLPAPIVEVPGRSFPVVKHFLEDYLPVLRAAPEASWVFNQDSTLKYIRNEVSPDHVRALGMASTWAEPRSSQLSGDLELPYPLIVLIISHVLRTSSSGHVLVFLPGWDEIIAVQRCLQDLAGPFARTFTNPKEYRIHLLHSTIPLAEQQLIFEPPPEGVRRIILATNIAETSVTIPDVVYVVDTAKIKEVRYDPDRHMSALVSAWVGASNLNQRAGRAGRHRPGEYFGVLGRGRADQLSPYQTVEMKRVDLSNVVMHVKAHDFPGMTVQEVLAATIEPPASERVTAAIKDLHMVGALDGADHLTSLGHVLLQLPVEVQMGRLVLLGCFFRCLDSALTLAAILTNRDPFMSPMHLKVEAQARKDAFTTSEYRSDALATLRAYKAWAAMQENGEYLAANRFCVDNFLSKPTLLMIQKIRTHLLQSLHQSGVIAVSGGGIVSSTAERQLQVPSELNHNANSMPLLGALVAIASQPKFAVRTGEKTFRTAQDKVVDSHISSRVMY
jgi:small subunit ribosomal protein S24e